MICQKCQEKPAIVHVTKVNNFEKTELHLCEECAKAVSGELGLIFEPKFTFQNLIAGLLEGEVNLVQQPQAGKQFYCENCGLTFSDFRNRGLLGCGECYRYFRNGLDPLLKRVQGALSHTGKVPKRTGGKVRIRKEIEELRNELQQAISKENYERAAELRDEIKKREMNL